MCVFQGGDSRKQESKRETARRKRERKTTEQEIQQEGKLGKSLKPNPTEEDEKANK